MSQGWTNEAAINMWGRATDAANELMTATDAAGDSAKQHLVNPHLLRLLGEVAGRRILDAGCGNGYLSRMLAERGASVTGVEPAQALFEYCVRREDELGQGIQYRQADLSSDTDLGVFDVVITSMVLMSIPDWRSAMRRCVAATAPGGTFVFAIVHPGFEGLGASWSEHGNYQVSEYLKEYVIEGPAGPDFHRPVSAYLNELAGLDCRITEIVEPGLDPKVAAESGDGQMEAYVRFPNFLIVAAQRT